jgi:hypothetical protein
MEGSDLERMRGRRSLRRKPATVEKGEQTQVFFGQKERKRWRRRIDRQELSEHFF